MNAANARYELIATLGWPVTMAWGMFEQCHPPKPPRRTPYSNPYRR
jgi:hypothetical protein